MSNNLFAGFDLLYAAVVDASSIIYMQKAGFFPLAVKHIKMHSPLDVIEETGLTDLSVIEHEPLLNIVPDKQLIILSEKLNLPVISEDRKVLIAASQNGFSYYNSLMILNFLLYKKNVEIGMFDQYIKRLLSVARYSSYVIQFGEMVTKKILNI